MLNHPLVKLAITGAALYGLWRFGGVYGKGAALGVAGYIVANNTPIVRDGMHLRVIPNAAAA